MAKRLIGLTKAFKRDLAKYAKSQPEILVSQPYTEVLNTLARGLSLDEKYRDHALTGNWQGFRECHIFSDLLLIYSVEEREDEVKIIYTRLGTHSELFE